MTIKALIHITLSKIQMQAFEDVKSHGNYMY